MVIFVTGPIGSGKSIVVDTMGDEGATTIKLDTVADTLIETDTEIRRGLEDIFGTDLYDANGMVNKECLRKIFYDAYYRRLVNGIVHPKVYDYIEQRIISMERSEYVVIESPLPISDTPFKYGCYHICYVHCDEIVRLEHIMNRSKLSCKDAYIRMACQPSYEAYLREADDIIINRGTMTNLGCETRKLYYHMIGAKS